MSPGAVITATLPSSLPAATTLSQSACPVALAAALAAAALAGLAAAEAAALAGLAATEAAAAEGEAAGAPPHPVTKAKMSTTLLSANSFFTSPILQLGRQR